MNAVIIEPDGSWTLRGHRWAAEDLDLMLLQEPDAVIASLRTWEECDWFYDDVWAEGGVLVNAGPRELVFFGGFTLVRTIPMRRRYVELLGAVWAGWQVRWAWRHTADILGPVGLTPDRPDLGPALPVEWVDAGRATAPSADLYGHVLSVRDPAGKLRLYRARHWALRQVLTAGQGILVRIGPGRATLALPDPASWGDGAHIDVSSRSVACWSRDGLLPPPELDRDWPGWRLRFDEDRYENQVAECGGALVMPEQPLEQTVAEMIDSIARMPMPADKREFIETALRL